MSLEWPKLTSVGLDVSQSTCSRRTLRTGRGRYRFSRRNRFGAWRGLSPAPLSAAAAFLVSTSR